MIDKIKRVVKSAEEIETVKAALDSAMQEINEFKESMKKLESEFKEKIKVYDEANRKILTDKQVSLDKINSIGDDFQKELNDFKVMKTKLRSEVLEKASADIKEELSTYILNIKSKIENLNAAAEDIKKMCVNSKEMVGICDELKKISSSIKKEDFELTKYANFLQQNDKEKLELMKKIDTLERLVAKQRRRQ